MSLDLDICFRERKLRVARPDALKAKMSLETAESMLNTAQELKKAGFEAPSLVHAYASMFHSGRALLFKDGIVEKSHYCLVEYVREKYAKTGRISPEIVTVMDVFRGQRHDVLYSLEGVRVKPVDAKMAIENAVKMLEAVRKILG